MNRIMGGLMLALCVGVACYRTEAVEEIRVVAVASRPAAAIEVAEGDWPGWRGPGLDGVGAADDVPTHWSADENVVWKADVPGTGHSSPAVVGSRVFLTTADEGAQTQRLLAYDRKTGTTLWDTAAHTGGFMAQHRKNTQASASPVCDGQRVYAAFINGGALHVTAADLEGKIVWQKNVGPFRSMHGYGSSPVLYQGLVIVVGDGVNSGFLAALDRANGEIRWRTARKTISQYGNYGTPVVATVAGKPQLVVHGGRLVTSYDPDTGELIWQCDGPCEVSACTVAFSDDFVFASGGFPEREVLAIRADGKGDVTKTHVTWQTHNGMTYVPSPLYHDGLLYAVNDQGIASCWDAATGKELWGSRRLGESFSGSPVLAGGYLFSTSEGGTTYVLRAGTSYEKVAANTLGEPALTTPAVAGGQLFLRTETKLYCIGKVATAGR